jgi:hypothetical protein
MDYLRSMMHNYRRWAAFIPDERGMLIQAVFLLPIVHVCRRMGFQRVQRFLSVSPPAPGLIVRGNAMKLETARRVARVISIAAARSVCRISCLDRSVLLWFMLRRRGIDSDLQLGVRTDQGYFEAHAWVEVNGEVVNDSKDVRQRFAPFPVPISSLTAAGDHLH